MKSAVKAVVLFALFGAVLAHAQPVPGQFEHVILVIQENRTPDNLFGGNPTFEPGVDLQPATGAQPWCLGACFDPNHGNSSWKGQYNAGGNACGNEILAGCLNNTKCNGQPVCSGSGCIGLQNPIQLPSCTPDTYVSATYDNSVVSPYFDIAQKYGFANYFYQTNQGPSQSAHDFLFGGTSSPTGSSSGSNGQYLFDFAAGNPSPAPTKPTGCLAPQTQYRSLINPDAQIFTNYYYPCFDHQTLYDMLKAAGLTWKYYTNDSTDIWTAPNGISHLCVPEVNPQTGQLQCTGSDFTSNVVTPPTAIFADFHLGTNLPGGNGQGVCHIPNVSWVIPNGDWSDHPGLSGGESSTGIEGGPNWVANIINAVGNATCKDEIGNKPWQDTVIFVVWDDWGGWYDHLATEIPQGYYEVNWPNCTPEYGDTKLYAGIRRHQPVLGLRLYLRVPCALPGSLCIHE